MEEKNLPNDNSLFGVASITKVFTGSLVAKAVLDKKMSLDTDIRSFLPHSYPNLEYDGKPISVKNLVTYTLGFQTPKKLESVYKKIEYDLIKYPKINWWSKLEPLFYENPKKASKQYPTLRKDTIK